MKKQPSNQEFFKTEVKVMYDAQLLFRLPVAHKEAFIKLCEEHKTDPSTVLRNFVAAQVTTQPAKG